MLVSTRQILSKLSLMSSHVIIASFYLVIILIVKFKKIKKKEHILRDDHFVFVDGVEISINENNIYLLPMMFLSTLTKYDQHLN